MRNLQNVFHKYNPNLRIKSECSELFGCALSDRTSEASSGFSDTYFKRKLEKSKFKAEIKRVVQKRGKNPKKISSSKASETNQTIPKFINILEKPKVRKCRGRVTIFKIGLIKKLAKPKIIPKIIIICQRALILNPKISDAPGITFI